MDELTRRQSQRSRFNVIQLFALAVATVLTTSCGREPGPSNGQPAAKKHILTVGIREDWKLVAEYSGTGRNNLTKWSQKTEDGPFELYFAGMHLPPGAWYTEVTTQYNDAYVTGSLQPLDTNWDYFACAMQIDSQVPIDILFSGIFSTNASNTNDEGTLFISPSGKTNLSFTGKLVTVFEKPTSRTFK